MAVSVRKPDLFPFEASEAVQAGSSSARNKGSGGVQDEPFCTRPAFGPPTESFFGKGILKEQVKQLMSFRFQTVRFVVSILLLRMPSHRSGVLGNTMEGACGPSSNREVQIAHPKVETDKRLVNASWEKSACAARNGAIAW